MPKRLDKPFGNCEPKAMPDHFSLTSIYSLQQVLRIEFRVLLLTLRKNKCLRVLLRQSGEPADRAGESTTENGSFPTRIFSAICIAQFGHY
jgi:hypothetical protein